MRLGVGKAGLAKPALDRFLPRVQLVRFITVLVVFVAWCSAMLHAQFDAIGFGVPHCHHLHIGHDHGHDDATDHPTADEQSPFVARTSLFKDEMPVAGVFAKKGWADWAILAAVVALLAQTLRFDASPPSWRPDRSGGSAWHFVLRCAPLATAPPAAV